MIPKIIHYCWFGGNEKTILVKRCIESWKKCCPDYKIIEWNENNYPIDKIKYTREAYIEKKWAFVTDFVRLDVVNKYGGIYLDVDVELIKNLDELLKYECFFAREKPSNIIATGLGFGASKNNLILDKIMKVYENLSFIMDDGSYNLTACPHYSKHIFESMGFVDKDITQQIENCIVLSTEYFCPLDYTTRKLHVESNTYGIHWYDASWLDKHDKKLHDMDVFFYDRLPLWVARPITYVIRKIYRFFQYMFEGRLMNMMRRSRR